MQRMISASVVLLLVTLAVVGSARPLEAQGVTTSALTGRVTDEAGQPIAGVGVTVTNTATGWTGQTVTSDQGRYVVAALRPGGPYRVAVQLIGYRPETVEGLMLVLGETRAVDIDLAAAAVELEAVEVTGAAIGTDVSGGVSTVVSESQIRNLPTLNREIVDLARFTPQAFVSNEDDDGAAISIAGQNAEFNGFFVDGVVNNDVFGLSAQGTNGGQTGAPPIGFDALEQLQIAISPYDVSQSGFTGGAISTITRSGTNRFEGSAYYQLRTDGLAGKTPGPEDLFDADNPRERLPDFSAGRYGFRLGGPIIEDKMFFFVNGELFRSETPRAYLSSAYDGDSGFDPVTGDRIDPSPTAELISSVVQEELGYDAGDFRDQASTLDDNKLLAKLDWNLSATHRLSVRHSYSHADNQDAFGSGGGGINFVNNREVFPNTTNSTALELNSRLGNQYSNRLLIGATFVRDDRGFAGEPFPSVEIEDGDGSFFLGSEPFSTGNILNQDIFTVTNNFNIFRDRHTFTIGANFEYYDIFNLFIRQNFGQYVYASVDDFLQSVCAAGSGTSSYCQTTFGGTTPAFVEPEDFDRGYSLVDDELGDASSAAAGFQAYQVGLYLQDEFQATDRLRLTAGLRVDIPKITTKPGFSDDVDATIADIVAAGYDLEGAQPGETPKAQPYLAPRVGFNYDLAQDRSVQLRGGVGLFTGRVPFVYPGAMYTNNGVTTGFVTETELPAGSARCPGVNDCPAPFIPNAENGLEAADFGLPDRPSGELDMFTESFKYPRVLRTSLGLDAALPGGFFGTIEAQYTKTLDNIIIQNVNYRAQNDNLAGPDNRPVYNYGFNNFFGSFDVNATLIDPRYSNGIYKVGSTSDGYAYDISASLQKSFLNDDLLLRLAYTFGDAFSLNDATSDQIASTHRFNENVNGLNNLDLARSDWSIGHRVLGLLSFEKEFLGNLGTTIQAVYVGESGRPYSFIIGNNFGFTGEGAGTQPLAYIPNSAADLTFCDLHANFRCAGFGGSGAVILSQAAQEAAFDAFMARHPYLVSRQGDYAERNAQRTPFEHVIDLKLAQDLFANVGGRRNTVSVTLDIFNFTNLLNAEWGQRFNPGFRTVDLVRFERFVAEDDLTPIYTFRFPTFTSADEEAGIQDMDEYWSTRLLDFGTYGSRWQMQLGVRYTF
jgi:outer membrane receptor protein involved in Fe transport